MLLNRWEAGLLETLTSAGVIRCQLQSERNPWTELRLHIMALKGGQEVGPKIKTYCSASAAAAQLPIGQLDILVNNAGIYKAAPLGQITKEHLHGLFNLNVLGLILPRRKRSTTSDQRAEALSRSPSPSYEMTRYAGPGGIATFSSSEKTKRNRCNAHRFFFTNRRPPYRCCIPMRNLSLLSLCLALFLLRASYANEKLVILGDSLSDN
jgi:short chain dehydrogenase